jgi:hypothetical protein
MMQRQHPDEAIAGASGAFEDEAIRHSPRLSPRIQGPHPTADRGLTNAEHLCRSAEAQMLGHEQGLSDGIDIDHAPDLLSLSFASAEGDSLARPYWQNRGDVCRLLTPQVRHRHWDYQALY